MAHIEISNTPLANWNVFQAIYGRSEWTETP